jgi:Protein of unknown function (DUF1488)
MSKSRSPSAASRPGSRPSKRRLPKAGEALTFHPNRAVYDRAAGVVWFFAAHGPLLERCGVLDEALAAIDHLRAERLEIPEQVFQRHRERFHEVAARKYRAEQFDRPGVILVRPSDLASN